MARRSGRVIIEDDETELNITPMLDVVFILLIFFIVTAVFVKEPGVEVEKPDVVLLEGVRPAVLIAVTADDQVFINKREVDIRDIQPVIEGLVAENPKGTAIVQGDGGAKFSTVYRVMDTLQQVGVESQYVSVDQDR